jgi:hypothetical protein
MQMRKCALPKSKRTGRPTFVGTNIENTVFGMASVMMSKQLTASKTKFESAVMLNRKLIGAKK